MKKNIIFILLASLCLFKLTGKDNSVQKSEQVSKKSNIVVTGYVLSKGNDPFLWPAIKGDDGKEYTIMCPEKQKRKLLDLQGRHLRFTLVQNDQVSYVVKKFKVIKN